MYCFGILPKQKKKRKAIAARCLSRAASHFWPLFMKTPF